MADELVERLVEGIPRLRFWGRFESMRDVGAFALCTDDAVSTMVACAAPKEWLSAHRDVTFWPPDYPVEESGDSALNLAGDLMEQRYRSALAAAPPAPPGDADISAYVEATFTHYVDALEMLKLRRFFEPETILLVFGTTPTPAMLQRGTLAVARLNGAGVLADWHAFWPSE